MAAPGMGTRPADRREQPFHKLPTKFDVHEWAIMRDFADSMEPARIREDLQFAIHGAGAFRHVKRTLERHHIEPAGSDSAT